MNTREIIGNYLLIENVLFKLRYIDYEVNEWTAPVLLTRERSERFLSDNSVADVILIQPNGVKKHLKLK